MNLVIPAERSRIISAAGTKVFLTLPWYKSVSPLTAYCVTKLVERNRCTTCLNFGDAFVAHTRNTCADLFLGSQAEWQLTIDDDMIVPFGNATWFNAYSGFNLPEPFCSLNAIDRLLSHGKTLVGALYFGRHRHARAVYCEGANQPIEATYARKAPHNICKPTRWVGTGCMLIHRSVYEAIEQKFPRLARGKTSRMGGNWFSTSEHSTMDFIDKARDVLAKGAMDGEKCLKVYQILEQCAAEARSNSSLGMGEDVQFCTRAAQAGHQPHVDMGLVCGHIGTEVYGPGNTFEK